MTNPDKAQPPRDAGQDLRFHSEGLPAAIPLCFNVAGKLGRIKHDKEINDE